jgi:lysophospholipase L1-like esterase
MPPVPGLANNTFRQIVRVSIGGDLVRLRFTNIFSKDTLTMKSVVIAVWKEGSIVEVSTQKLLKFRRKKDVTILPGTEVVSDPLKFKLTPGSRLAITIAFGRVPANLTGHPASRTTSYILTGNNALSVDFAGAIPTDHWYVINGIDVKTSKDASAIAILGNSIADGRGSGTNKQNRWSDILSEKLLKNPETSHCGVLNLGIGGNCVVQGGLGPIALNRFDRDILSQNNVKWLIITLGVNDIGGIKTAEDAPKVVEDLINAYMLLIDKAHAKGLKVYGATILPFAKSFYDKDFRLGARDKVNDWIRNSRKFDAVIDFDSLMRQSDDPETILQDVHSGDFLHPNEAGYKKMGEFVNLELFKL